MLLLMVFSLLGALDRILENRFGYGDAYSEGFRAMGTIALSIAGVYASAPLLSRFFTPIALRLLAPFGLDISLLPGLLLSSDMGAYEIALSMTENESIAAFSGLILGGTIGSVWLFSIPVAFSIVKSDDVKYVASGLLCGLVTMPLSSITGGIMMAFTSYKLALSSILINTLPVLLISLVTALGLWFKPGFTIRLFRLLSWVVTGAMTFFLSVAAFEEITGVMVPFFSFLALKDKAGLTGLDRGLLVSAQVALVLSGAFPLIEFIKKHFNKLLTKIGNKCGINSSSSSGFLASLSNIIPMYSSFHMMDRKGKILNAAFASSGAFVFGDHLAFTSAVNPDMVLPLIASKLTGGISALLLASLVCHPLLKKLDGEG